MFEKESILNSVVIGSGPAGSTAAIYLARANMNPVMFSGFNSGPKGGQLTTTTIVENFPGFPDGVDGTKLVEDMLIQAEKFGTNIIDEDVVDIENKGDHFCVYVGSSRKEVKTKTVIVASGAYARRLYVPGTNDGELWQKGVSTCAVCDGALPIFRNKTIVVIGGGDSAMEEAIYMTRYSSKVIIVNRSNKFKASKIMLDRATNDKKIEILEDMVLQEVLGKNKVESAIFKKNNDDSLVKIDTAGVFFAIGHIPNTTFLEGRASLLDDGRVRVTDGTTETSVKGIFAAGDVADGRYRQAVKASGDGCAAALDAIRYIELLD